MSTFKVRDLFVRVEWIVHLIPFRENCLPLGRIFLSIPLDYTPPVQSSFHP